MVNGTPVPHVLVTKQRYLYLATPYSKYPLGLEAAYKDACRAAGFILGAGINVFCPIAHSHPISMYGGCEHVAHDFWMRVDRPMMDHAHGMVVVEMPGWRESVGVQIEIETFTKARKPIHYLRWPLQGPRPAFHQAPETEPSVQHSRVAETAARADVHTSKG